MYMNQENKNKIAVIGHTKGIGKAIAKLYKKKGFEIVGLSRSNGYDLENNKDEDNYGADYNEYCWHKEHLIKYVSELQEELFNKPLSVYDICPDVVDTDMIKGMWEGLPKLKTDEVADAVRYCFESPFNINKLVLQKNAT